MLSDEEKTRTRYFLGYSDVESGTTSIAGVTVDYEYLPVVVEAIEKINESAEPRLRQLLQKLESVEEQLASSEEMLGVTELSGIKLNVSEAESLDKAYVRWAHRLGELLGVRVNPHSERFKSGINARVLI